MKKLLTLCILTFLSIRTFAYDVEIDGIYYNLDKDAKTASVTFGSSKYDGVIIIPEKINSSGISYSVTGISNIAFLNSTVTSVDIPNSVTNIGPEAFCGCSVLTTVTIPNSVTSIGYSAFADCTKLISVTIPNKITEIASDTFLNCSSLTAIVIPANVTKIGGSAFASCTCLTSVEIGNRVTSISGSAFGSCPNLNTIYCLNPTPPVCYGVNVFRCSGSIVRDQDDVYTYANLHVPMGCKEIYAASHVWRYFNKIKEDMEYNGTVYFANLTVQQGTTGYTRQAVKADETYTIFIGSFGDNMVNAVTFNGEDVTDEVVNGYYTTPEIKGESVLTVSYETKPEGIPSAALKNVRVTGFKDAITISNIEEASDVFVYSTDGILIDTVLSAYGTTTINVPSEQIYIVKVGDRIYKIAI